MLSGVTKAKFSILLRTQGLCLSCLALYPQGLAQLAMFLLNDRIPSQALGMWFFSGFPDSTPHEVSARFLGTKLTSFLAKATTTYSPRLWACLPLQPVPFHGLRARIWVTPQLGGPPLLLPSTGSYLAAAAQSPSTSCRPCRD